MWFVGDAHAILAVHGDPHVAQHDVCASREHGSLEVAENVARRA